MKDKAELRKELLRRRDQIPPEVRKAKNRMIRERLLSLDEFKNAGVIFFFASFRTEVDTAELIKSALSSGKRIVLPRVNKDRHELLLYEIHAFSELTPEYMGIPEPPLQDNQMSINDVDLVIIPGAGFDASGNRIGYGGGYYDGLLSGLQKPIPVIAPAYEEQLVDSLPSEPHDIKVQMIVTDRQLIRCKPQQ
ncbi:MAG: 5-formyltetrahydrofolate cyclo-ligase [Nitrospira bacterium HGW-Nitrospira-1]|nr:MAG: 5-formyltetrahydrofolate cyclo-ligase [Nitrospira bacterium HGW-Nitrospira-1]